ncbi:hypothetical protein B0T18DRAFT_428819 [Schizothecium vesticola]|uniref:Transmembrane protein n=1 Tax=Schizothecium vesticola TaxID=314040 RepID=A0AA40EUM5_9PEZI|nr:hypothetical protein B0T18DRAFT_428819 [Schizothecium vesticola]
MQPRISLPLYVSSVPSATLVQTLLTFHPHPSILKLLLPLNIIFVLLLIARHLAPLVPFLTPKLLLVPFLFLPLLPLSLISVLFVLLTDFLLHTTTSLALLLLAALGVTGIFVTLITVILYGIVIGDPRRRRLRPRRRRVPPSPWPERPHIADWTWDDQEDVVPDFEWEMPEGLATWVPRIYRRLGVQYYFYRRLRETRKRRGIPEALRLGTYSNYFKIDGGESEEGQAA